MELGQMSQKTHQISMIIVGFDLQIKQHKGFGKAKKIYT